MTWRWLESTIALQRDYFGVDLTALAKSGSGEDMLKYINNNVLAGIKEFTEVLDNFVWKPWATKYRGVIIDRDEAVEELVDVAHFVANIACALGVTDDEWERVYTKKQELNRQRQRRDGGYQGINGV